VMSAHYIIDHNICFLVVWHLKVTVASSSRQQTSEAVADGTSL
jgi:hypothetical protein